MHSQTVPRPAASPQLGASLYIPATHPDLASVLAGNRFPHLRSVIVCLEDAVSDTDVPAALQLLELALPSIGPRSPLCFVRPRTIAMLRHVLQFSSITSLAGFALPKATEVFVRDALALRSRSAQWTVMPILETAEVFDADAMRRMATFLAASHVRPHVTLARIGGNDLLRILGLRRDVSHTIYASPLGPIIAQLVTTFAPRGIPLSAPVFDGLGSEAILRDEVRLDIAHGLIAKTAVHPDQVLVIEALYRPSRTDVEMARALLAPAAPAVFRMHDRMCETVVHQLWAERVLDRAVTFGIAEQTEVP